MCLQFVKINIYWLQATHLWKYGLPAGRAGRPDILSLPALHCCSFYVNTSSPQVKKREIKLGMTTTLSLVWQSHLYFVTQRYPTLPPLASFPHTTSWNLQFHSLPPLLVFLSHTPKMPGGFKCRHHIQKVPTHRHIKKKKKNKPWQFFKGAVHKSTDIWNQCVMSSLQTS